jgi:hypothetical protein
LQKGEEEEGEDTLVTLHERGRVKVADELGGVPPNIIYALGATWNTSRDAYLLV